MIFLCRALAVTPLLTRGMLSYLSCSLAALFAVGRLLSSQAYGISFFSRRWFGLLTTNISSPILRACRDLRVMRWLMLPLRLVNLPEPVILKRRAAPLCVFSLGICCLSVRVTRNRGHLPATSVS